MMKNTYEIIWPASIKRIALGLMLVFIILATGSMISGCKDKGAGPDQSTADTSTTRVEEGASYDTKDEVADYIVEFDKLPPNYMTKKEARSLGWEGGSVEEYAPGKCIGGDRFGNYEGSLPSGEYLECDIDTLGRDSRGAKRLVFSDEEIYYTEDHYKTFEKVCDR